MKPFLMVVTLLVVGIIALICWQRWDEKTNRGYSWGYWGEFNAVSNSLARLPGITVVKGWCNADFLVLEEMGFTVTIQGKTVDIAFGEKDPVRKLRGRALEKGLMEMIQKESSNKSLQRTRRSVCGCSLRSRVDSHLLNASLSLVR